MSQSSGSSPGPASSDPRSAIGPLLATIDGPADLKRLPVEQLPELGREIRDYLIEVVLKTGGHLSSNLGVVELTMALHWVFDFPDDCLVWDVGHQCYVHKILTGRRDRLPTLRQFRGLSGFSNKYESKYDTFLTGHAGTAISSALGIAAGDALVGRDRNVVAVVGDASIACGVAFEGLNHGGEIEKDLLIILNDNEMSISRPIGSLSKYLTKLRVAPLYAELKKDVHKILKAIPVVGERMDRSIEELLDTLKTTLVPGHFFEALGFKYFGPIDGHDVGLLTETLEVLKAKPGVRLLHVLTKKGHGCDFTSQNPTRFHGVSPGTSAPTACLTEPVADSSRPQRPSFTGVFGSELAALAEENDRIVALTAAMPDGTGLTEFGQRFPDRYFDTGITEQHAVAFATGLCEAGLRPVAAIYSTFLQRGYDEVWQEIVVQNNPVVLAIDRAGLVGNDGATHHGVFDIAYLRTFPNIVLMSPKDAAELRAMLRFAVDFREGPIAIRYPRGACPEFPDLPERPITLGRGELLREGSDAVIVAYGHMVAPSLEACERLAAEGLSVGLVNARFAKPLDEELILEVLARVPRVFTVEDHVQAGGFGAACLELAARDGRGLAGKIGNFVVPDQLVEHGDPDDLMRLVGLDPESLADRIARSLRGEVVEEEGIGFASWESSVGETSLEAEC